MKKELIAQKDPKSPISEIFRTLRTNIQFMNTKGSLKSILVTSTLPGEGKSWVSSNLAVTFAQAGKKVVLIDADMRKGRQYNIFEVAPTPGLSNYLSGIGTNIEDSIDDLANYIQETDVDNLYVITAGNIPPNPSELLGTERMANLLEKLKRISDIIIIDGTPSQLVTDSLILTTLVDTTLIVTASKQTKKEDLKRIINNIKNVGGKIAGVVVNKLPISSKKYEQSYYYGSTSMTKSKPQARRQKQEMYNRAVKALDVEEKRVKQIETKKKVAKENDTITKSNFDVNSEKNNKDLKNDELKNNIKIENANEVSIEKTTDILNQINQYLDEEKKKLKE